MQSEFSPPSDAHCLLWTFVRRGLQGKEVSELQVFLSLTFVPLSLSVKKLH